MAYTSFRCNTKPITTLLQSIIPNLSAHSSKMAQIAPFIQAAAPPNKAPIATAALTCGAACVLSGLVPVADSVGAMTPLVNGMPPSEAVEAPENAGEVVDGFGVVASPVASGLRTLSKLICQKS